MNDRGVSINYNGDEIVNLSGDGSLKLLTKNKYMEDDIEVDITRDMTIISKSVTENGVYDAEDDDADGYDTVTVNLPNTYTASDEGKVVSSGALVGQTSKTVTGNGSYNTTLYNEVVVNVQGGSAPIADWDFTQSLIDSVNGLEATLTSGASRDSNGVTISGSGGRIVLPKGVQGFMRTFEIEVGDITSATGSVFFITSGGDGIGYKDGSWRLYSGSWDTATNVTDLDAFANGVIKVYIDENGYWHIYKDDVLLWDSNKTLVPANQTATIGYSSNSLRTMVIKSVKVY